MPPGPLGRQPSFSRKSARMKRSAVLAVLLACLCQELLGQEFRTRATVTGQTAVIGLDLSRVSSLRGGTLTLHNSSKATVLLPQLADKGAPWPYSLDAIKQNLPRVASDQDFAIATWRFVVEHNFHTCSAGTKTDSGMIYITDPILDLNGFGFGCCDQVARELAWIWQQSGYPSRLAIMPFHTLAEIFYAGAWHMFDADHRVYYLLSDGHTVASVADILADPSLILQSADANGNDPVGYSAALLAEQYAENGPDLQYMSSGFYTNSRLSLSLRPHEQLTLDFGNFAGKAQLYDYGNAFTFKNVASAEFSWDLSYANLDWASQVASSSGVTVKTITSNGLLVNSLVNTDPDPGYVVYRESSVFPALALTVLAQTGNTNGYLLAYLSTAANTWSAPVPSRRTITASGFQWTADLTSQAEGQYTYFVKIELHDAAQVRRLRLQPVVQTAKWIFPQLTPGSVNHLTYSDSSLQPVIRPAQGIFSRLTAGSLNRILSSDSASGTQGRNLQVVLAAPLGSPQIRGLQAESLQGATAILAPLRDCGPANLVDGDPDSQACPGGRHMDYVIHLGGLYTVTGISLDWNQYGTQRQYVAAWKLYARVGSQSWQPLVGGGFPGAPTTDVAVNSVATDLRLVADSTYWLGIYDMRVFGNAMPSLPASDLMTFSNVTEDPTYSIGAGYQASNLTDGDLDTLAYPASTHIDYQIGLPGPVFLPVALITWGQFGTNPAYVEHWQLLGRSSAVASWTVLDSGRFPNSASTAAAVGSLVTDLRLVADSHNWIGAYEVQLYGTPPEGFPGLTGIAVTDNVIESPSAPSYRPPANIVDGDDSTLAYPGSRTLDFTLDLGRDTYVDSVSAVWGGFGTDPIYIDAWRLYGLRQDATTWELVAQGPFPNSSETTIPVHNRYRKLRLAADSAVNPIGMYEARVFGLQ